MSQFVILEDNIFYIVSLPFILTSSSIYHFTSNRTIIAHWCSLKWNSTRDRTDLSPRSTPADQSDCLFAFLAALSVGSHHVGIFINICKNAVNSTQRIDLRAGDRPFLNSHWPAGERRSEHSVYGRQVFLMCVPRKMIILIITSFRRGAINGPKNRRWWIFVENGQEWTVVAASLDRH